VLTSLVGYRVIDGRVAHYLLGRTVSMEHIKRQVGEYVEITEVCKCGHRPSGHRGKMCTECKGLGTSCRAYRSIVPEFLGEPLNRRWRQVRLVRQFQDKSWLAQDRLGKVTRFNETELGEVVGNYE
jgi:hypothetical protein